MNFLIRKTFSILDDKFELQKLKSNYILNSFSYTRGISTEAYRCLILLSYKYNVAIKMIAL